MNEFYVIGTLHDHGFCRGFPDFDHAQAFADGVSAGKSPEATTHTEVIVVDEDVARYIAQRPEFKKETGE